MKVIDLCIKTKYGREITKNFNLVINSNDKLALIGEEGNGKSTFLKYLYNPKLIEDYCFFKGVRDLPIRIGYLPQAFPFEWLSLGVSDFFLKDTPISEENYDMYNNLYIIEELFNKYKLAFIKFTENQSLATLSGGEKIKIQLIKLEYSNYDLLLLDEPTNDLDIETICLLEGFINQTSTPIVYISHDERLLENTANRILHFEQIKRKTEMKLTLENVSYKEYLKLREAKINAQNSEAYRSRREYKQKKEILLRQHQLVQNHLNQAIKNPSEGRILAKKMKNILSQENKLDKMKITDYFQPEEAINLFFEEDASIPNSRIILNIENYNLCISNIILSKGINLSIKGRERVIIIGKNGIGKTTFLKSIYDNLKSKTNLSIGYMPQNYDEDLDLKLSSVEYLQKYLGYDNDIKTKIMSCLGALNFVVDEMYDKIENLSGGQKAKLYLLKLVLCKNNVLLLDEPTRNLSPLSVKVIKRILSNFNGTIISVSHDRAFIDDVATKVYELSENGLLLVK